MNKLKCKDYFIFKLRYYADKKILDQWRETNGLTPTQQIERANLFIEFLWNLIEKVTNKTQYEWCCTYMFQTTDCALDEMEETHGIHQCIISEGYYTYFIPTKHTDIIEWIKLNIKSPYKILKQSSIGYVDFNKDHYYLKNDSKERTEKLLLKIFIEQNTRKVLLEKIEFQ